MLGLRPFFTYYGGKWRIAPRYPAPRFPVIVEPFAGSAGYALRYSDRTVRLVDKDPTIAGLWQYLIRVSSAEILALPIEVEDVRVLPVPPEARALIGFWLNKGTTAPCNIPSKWMRDRWRPKSFWGPEIRERIAAQVDGIRHWRAYCASYDQIPDGEGTWFVDPPYTEAGRYRENEIDYARVAEWTRSRRGQVIACEQAGATWLPFRPFHVAKALEGVKGHKRSPEVIWTSDDPLDLASVLPPLEVGT
jgi:hypothetical protein